MYNIVLLFVLVCCTIWSRCKILKKRAEAYTMGDSKKLRRVSIDSTSSQFGKLHTIYPFATYKEASTCLEVYILYTI